MIDLRKKPSLSVSDKKAIRFISETINVNIKSISYNDLMVHLQNKCVKWENDIERLSVGYLLTDEQQELLDYRKSLVKYGKELYLAWKYKKEKYFSNYFEKYFFI